MSEAEVCTAVEMGMKVSALYYLLQKPLNCFALLKTHSPLEMASTTSELSSLVLNFYYAIRL